MHFLIQQLTHRFRHITAKICIRLYWIRLHVYVLVKNHPFVDGNKRIGTHAMLVFLAINGIELEYQDTELIILILSVASGEQTDADILRWLQKHIV